MTMTKEQEAILLRAEEQMKRNAVNPTTNQPGDVPAFQPVGVSGYDPQSGEVNPNDSTLGKAGSFVNGAVDLPVLGPAMKAGAAGGAALLTKGIDTLTGLPSSDTLAERYAAMRDMQESSMATNPKSAMAGRVAGTLLTGRGLPMPASAGGGAVVGAGLGAADTVARDAAKGQVPSAGELALQTGVGAAGGLLGHYLGRATADFLGKRGLGNSVPSKAAQAAIEERMGLENAAGNAMDASGVTISRNAMREFVDKTLTNLGETESLSRNGTPDAWKAARVLLNEVGKNQDLTLRDFNNLRIRVRDILPYTASGTEEYIVNKMSQDMNDFILKLPIGNPKVVTGGDAQAGVQAWQDMNKFTMEKMKSEILGRLAYKSQLESSQGGKNITFGQALQTHVLDFLTRSSGKAMDELKLFKPSEINALEDFVAGSKSVAFDNMLNTYIGTGLAAGTTRALIRGGAVGIKSATGGGDAGTKAAFIDAIRNSGSSETIPDLTNINLSPAAATLADSMSRAYSDHQSKVDTILNAERMQTQSQQPQQGFPKSTVVPPTTGGQ